MIAIKQQSRQQKLTPNILPCAIRHDGPVPVDRRYWNPTTNDKDEQTVYFRGRKLEGTVVRIPEGYEGVVLQKSDERLLVRPDPSSYGEDGVQLDLSNQPVETKLFSKQGTFDNIVVLGHEAVPDAGDPYVKGIKEWIAFAEAMHTDETLDGES